jgi:carbamoyl-phosphate synthase large subunit
MKSTGEVLGLAQSFGLAFYKAQEAAQGRLPLEGTVLLTLADQDKTDAAVEMARRFAEMGFLLKATQGTQSFLAARDIAAERVFKMREKRPHLADHIMDGEIQLVINTPRGKASKADDAYIRQAAIRYRVPYITTIAAGLAAAKGIAARRDGDADVNSLQEYHAALG